MSSAKMEHRHLHDPGLTLAAIDDIIERGDLSDWVALGIAVEDQEGVRTKVRRIVEARSGQQSTLYHDFWRTRLALRPGRSNETETVP